MSAASLFNAAVMAPVPALDAASAFIGSSTAITGTGAATAVTVRASQSGGLFPVTQGAAACTVNVPAASAAMVGASYRFVLVGAAAGTVTVTGTGAGSLFGTLVRGNAVVAAVGGNAQITFAGGAAAAGDTIELFYAGVGQVIARGFSSNAAGITVA
jgi:hypothetical protein